MTLLHLKKFIRSPLFLPLLIGLILRLASIPFTNHIFYPDELFQSLEQSYRLVYGHGLIPWDIAYGLRSYIPILIGALPIFILKIAGFTDPTIYIPAIKTFLALISLSLIYFAYHFTFHLSKNKNTALLAAYGTAIWYELVYFSTRLFSETIAAALILLAVALLHLKKPQIISAFLLLTLGLVIRPQYAPLGLLFLPILLIKTKRRRAAIGISLALIATIALDFWSHGAPFMPLINNVALSFQSGISTIFGTKPWWFYITSSLIASAGIWLLALTTKQPRAKVTWTTIAILLIIHSLIAHKEYRFLFILIPLLIPLTSLGLIQVTKNKPTFRNILIIISILISVSGMFSRLPSQARVYGQPLLATDPMLSIYSTLHHNPYLCSLFDASRNWVYTPAYAYLNRDIPIYSADYPPPNTQNISHYIYPKPQLEIDGFTPVFSTPDYTTNINGQKTILPGYIIYQNTSTSPCQSDPSYTYYRSFPAVESILSNIGAKKILNQ